VTAVVKKLQNQLYGTEQQVQFKKLDAEKHNCDSNTSPCSNNTNITPYRKKGQLETAHHIEIKPTLLRWISLSPEDRQGYDKSGRRSQDICCNAKEVEELEHHIEMTPMQIAVGVRVCAFLVQTCFVLSVHFCVERKRRG
jgi:hypothetical protein